MGERTFGKGSVQSVIPLRNGSGLKLTTARYFTPSGRSIQAEGILPDVEIKPVQLVEGDKASLRESDLEGHLRHKSNSENAQEDVPDGGETVSAEEDYALHEALNILRGSKILMQRSSKSGTLHAELESNHD